MLCYAFTASSGDYLRLWEIKTNSIQPRGSLSASKRQESVAPISSFDWNPVEPKFIGTASINAKCSIWDIESSKEVLQVTAHEKDAFDISFGGRDTFVSVGSDGFMKIFDMRSPETPNVVYENPDKLPLLRVQWSSKNPNFIATINLSSNSVCIVDIRMPESSFRLEVFHLFICF